MTYPSDEAVMRAIQSGHLDMLGVLFERYHDRVLALCRGMTGDRSAADDLVQEAFMRILRYRASFQARSSFSTWLYRVVRNVCLDHLSARDRESDAFRRMAFAADENPREQPDDDERLRTLERALDRLAPEKRELLILSRIQGFRYAEIATACGANEGTVRVRAHRALRELKTIIGSMQDE